MANPRFIEQKPLSLGELKSRLQEIEKRDKELNYLSNKTKEYLENFVTLPPEKMKGLHKKLADLKLTRLKEEHIAKIIDFLPKNIEELKVVLQAYPLSMPKKDQESIIKVVAGLVQEKG